MKNDFKKIIFTIFLSFVVCISFIFYRYLEYNKIIIDNPSLKEIKVKIDSNDELVLAPKSLKTIRLFPWEHEVFLNWKSVWKFKKEKFDISNWIFSKNKKWILNPTKSNYFIEEIYFWEAPWNSSNNVIETSELFILNDFDYWLEEDLPKEVSLKDLEKFTTKTKIYRNTKYKFLTTQIDNPTDKQIKVKIDSWKEFTIEPWFVQNYVIEDWEHEVFLNWKSVWKFKKEYPKDYSMDLWYSVLNLFWVYYLSVEEIYWEVPEDYTYNETEKNWLFIYPDWNYNLTESFPEQVDLGDKKYVLMKKLYLRSEYYKSLYDLQAQ